MRWNVKKYPAKAIQIPGEGIFSRQSGRAQGFLAFLRSVQDRLPQINCCL